MLVVRYQAVGKMDSLGYNEDIHSPMPEIQHLSNPPISEALLDVRLDLAKDFNYKQLETIHDSVQGALPVKEISNRWQTFFQLKPGEQPVTKLEGGENGFFFKSSDSTKTLQVRTDGFTFNKLKPYESWETLISEAKTYWALYEQVVKNYHINRIALRYINAIEIPASASVTDYFTLVPNIPSGIPQNISESFIRLVVDDAQHENKANIILALDNLKSTEETKIFIFDIDVYRNISEANTNQLWEIFQSLRDFKDTIFFSGLTAKALEKYS